MGRGMRGVRGLLLGSGVVRSIRRALEVGAFSARAGIGKEETRTESLEI
jgi:hypothetical protein